MELGSSRASWTGTATSVFGQVMWLVAMTLGLFTLGAYVARHYR